MADSGLFTATLRLTVGELKVVHPITVPSAAVPATEIVPALQELVNVVVAAAEKGAAVSCRKGCGACCRQLVPISRTEGERLLKLIEAMPAERRNELGHCFGAAAAAIKAAGLDQRGERTDREVSLAYFALKVPCPFLEEDFSNIEAVNRGVKSRGFRGVELNPVQEIGVAHFHQVLRRYLRADDAATRPIGFTRPIP